MRSVEDEIHIEYVIDTKTKILILLSKQTCSLYDIQKWFFDKCKHVAAVQFSLLPID